MDSGLTSIIEGALRLPVFTTRCFVVETCVKDSEAALLLVRSV